MPVAVKKTYAAKDVALMMGIYTGVIGLSGSIGGLTASPLAAVNNKVVTPCESELEGNPRSRSAKLRIAEKRDDGE